MSETPRTEDTSDAGLKAAANKLEEAQRKGDLTAEGALTALAETHRTKLATREVKARLEKECKDRLDAAQAAFNNTIEAGLPTRARLACSSSISAWSLCSIRASGSPTTLGWR